MDSELTVSHIGSSGPVKPSYRPWSQEQDDLLVRLVKAGGSNCDWDKIDRRIGRTSCKKRWETQHRRESCTSSFLLLALEIDTDRLSHLQYLRVSSSTTVSILKWARAAQPRGIHR